MMVPEQEVAAIDPLASVRFPTAHHAALLRDLLRLFAATAEPSALLLGGSLARGRGHPTSDVDLLVLAPHDRLAAARAHQPDYGALGAEANHPEPGGATLSVGGLAAHIWITDGEIAPAPGGPVLDDPFELEVAALYVNGRMLIDRDGLHGRLAARYLPFYDDALRQRRLRALAAELRAHCAAVEHLAARGLGFAALDRLLTAFRALVLGLFLANRRYPLDLLKHLEEQVAQGLGRPDLLPPLAAVLTLPTLGAAAFDAKVATLRALWEAEVKDH